MSQAASVSPIGDAELGALLGSLVGRRLALAVSGGIDSMTLMHLVARWLAESGGPTTSAANWSAAPAVVLSVDHGLRAGSLQETELVAAAAQRLGLPHRTLRWEGEKPRTGIAEAARAARYALLAAAIAEEATVPPRVLVTAHHADDQAETFLMRLARGSGVEGLSAMREATAWRPAPGAAPLVVVRPLLQTPKTRLAATAAALGILSADDPTNADRAYERVRVRAAMPSLAPLGLTATAIGLAARRLARADRALIAATRRLLIDEIHWNEGIAAAMEAARYCASEEELSLRMLAAIISTYGARDRPPTLAQLEAVDHDLRGAIARKQVERWTLGGAVVAVRRVEGRAWVQVWREAGRAPPGAVRLVDETPRVWDGRFDVALRPDAERPVEVRALRIADMRDAGIELPAWLTRRLPRAAIETQPAFFNGSALLAAPTLARLMSLPPPGAKGEAPDAAVTRLTGTGKIICDLIGPS